MKMREIIVWAIFLSLILTPVLFFIINLKTVRRLRKNPITKDELGLSLVWGWHAITVSEALLFSKEYTTKRRKRSHGYMFANYDLVYQYTTPFEKAICKLFIILGVFSVLGILISGLLDRIVGFDIFDY